MADKDNAVVVHSRILKEGWVKRRNGRLHHWANRYFMLHDAGLTYKLKQDSAAVRGTFDFVPGTIVTDITEESLVKMKSNKLYSFWVVNPGGQNDKGAAADDKNYESDDDDEKEGDSKAIVTIGTSGSQGATSPAPANRNLQNIVRNELETQKRQKESAEEQVELHQAHDSNVTQGAMVAAVAVGGVVVGAMTMGIGLIPYFAVVGITAAATGGAVAFNRSKRPSNSRMIMAFETNKEAAEWKAAIESRIRAVAESRRPMLPDSVDAKTISAILDLGSMGALWKRVALYEGMCVLEHITYEKRGNMDYKYHPMMNFQDKSPFYTTLMTLVMDPDYMKLCIDTQNRDPHVASCAQGRATRVRKAQLSVCCSPVDTFLTLMNAKGGGWPRSGSFKVVKELDDHADIVAVEIVTDTTQYGGKSANLRRKMCVSRFWQLDDDGVYLVTYSSIKDSAVTPSLTADDVSKKSGKEVYTEENCDVQFDAVVTIAPRQDIANTDSDIPEAMVTCICQVGLNKGNWQKGEVTALMESFLKDNLLELRQSLWNGKYCVTSDNQATFVGPYLAPADHAPPLPTLERQESGEIPLSGDLPTAGGKLGSPSKVSVGKSASSGSKAGAHGVTTVQPGMEEEGADVAAAPKKRMGFLQRMKSSSSGYSKPAAPSTAATANDGARSPTAPLRKGYSTSTPGLASSAQRSVSPLGALLSSTKSSASAQPSKLTPIASQTGNRSRNTSSDAAADSDVSDTGGKFSSGRSPPGSPKAGANSSPTVTKKPQERTSSPPSKRRDKKTNAEASKLRNNISMMEYEVTRLNKSLRKRNVNLQALESQGQLHTEEQMQAVLDYNSEIQALHTQIARLTARQQSLKDEYFELTGEPFEPSKGTRGIMERWKGARLAHKEKDRWDTATVVSQAQLQAQAQAASGATPAGGNTATPTPSLRVGMVRTQSLGQGPGEERSVQPKPAHWEIARAGERLDAAVSYNLASLLRILARYLDPAQQLQEVTCDTYSASASNKSVWQRAQIDAALNETKAANLALVMVFTVSLVVVTLVANMLAI